MKVWGKRQTIDGRSLLWKTIKNILPFALAILFMWWLYRDIDLSRLWVFISTQVNYWILALSLLFGLLGNIFRGLRWQILILPLAPTTAPPKKGNVILTTLGTYCVNMLLPRAGEVWRSLSLAQREKISFASLLGTVLSDRLLDIVVIGGMTLALVLGYYGHLETVMYQFSLRTMDSATSSNMLLYSIVGVSAIAILALCLKRYIRSVLGRFRLFFSKVWGGVKTLFEMPHRGLFTLYTLLIWVCYFLFFFVTFFAFDFTQSLGIAVGFFAFTFSCIAVMIPIQAGMGAWHYAVIVSLVSYGVARSDAESFALVVHSVQTLWTTITGLFAIFALLLTDKKHRKVSN